MRSWAKSRGLAVHIRQYSGSPNLDRQELPKKQEWVELWKPKDVEKGVPQQQKDDHGDAE